MPSTQRFTGMDGLRGLAALAIVLCHLPLLTAASPSLAFQASQPFVLFFFVLSGFVLTHAHGQKLRSASALGRFVAGRTLRVFPLYLSLLGVILIVQLTEPGDLLPVAGNEAGSLESLLPHVMLLQAWLPEADRPGTSLAVSSLSAGYYLWLLFGVALLTLPRGRSVVFAGLIGLSLWALLSGSAGLSKATLLTAGAFFLGTLLYPLHQALRLMPLSMVAFTVLELTVLTVLALVLSSDYHYRVLYAIPQFALTLLIFAFEGGILSRLLRLDLFQMLGRWSFPLSLVHLVAFMLAAPHIAALDLTVEVLSYAVPAAALLGALLLAALSHHLIERPGMALRRLLQTEQSSTLMSQARG